jgi:hypothetical protein
LNPGSSSVELIVGELQARILVFVSCVSFLVWLGLPFIADLAVPVNYTFVPYKCRNHHYVCRRLVPWVPWVASYGLKF